MNQEPVERRKIDRDREPVVHESDWGTLSEEPPPPVSGRVPVAPTIPIQNEVKK